MSECFSILPTHAHPHYSENSPFCSSDFFLMNVLGEGKLQLTAPVKLLNKYQIQLLCDAQSL